MKLFVIQAFGNYGGGVAVVRAKSEKHAREMAAGIVQRGSWNVRYEKPEEVFELAPTAEGVLYHFETGE